MDTKYFEKETVGLRAWLCAKIEGGENPRVGIYDDVGFNMGTFVSETEGEWTADDYRGHTCGTTMCMAGFLANEYGVPKGVKDRSYDKAIARLCISELDADVLFYGSPKGVPFDKVTPQQALDTLERAIKTGIITWDAN